MHRSILTETYRDVGRHEPTIRQELAICYGVGNHCDIDQKNTRDAQMMVNMIGIIRVL